MKKSLPFDHIWQVFCGDWYEIKLCVWEGGVRHIKETYEKRL